MDVRSLGAWVWPQAAPPDDEKALDEHLRRMTIFYGAGCAVVLNLLHLVFWPLDSLLLVADPAVRAVMPWFRATTFGNHALFLLCLWVPGTRRFPLLLVVLCLLCSSMLFGVAMGRMGGLDRPYFYMMYLAPMGIAALPTRPLRRLWLGPACAATLCVSFFATRPGELGSPLLGSALGCMVFAVLISITIGHGMFLLARRAFLSELALARLSAARQVYGEHLEHEVAERERQLRRLATHLSQAAEAERARLSRELHDELGQQVTALRYTLVFVRQRLAPTAPRPPALGAEAPAETPVALALRGLGDMEEVLTQLAASVRHLVSDLRPRVLDDRGLGPALSWLVEQTRERSGLDCSLALAIAPSVEIPPDQAIAVFRIVQESLTNIVRHAAAQKVRVSLTASQAALTASVTDDGRGVGRIDMDRAGMGIFGMSERARAHGGRLDIEGRPGQGTTVRVALPLPGPVSGATA